MQKLGQTLKDLQEQQRNLQDQQAAAEREQRARQQAEQRKRIEAAAAAGDPNAKMSLDLATRLQREEQQKWSASRQSPASYDPRWMRQNLVIRGTVSRVDVDTTGSPQWLTIFFKEWPDSSFVVCSPYPNMFQEKVGRDLSALVGKTLEVTGSVEAPYCGHKVAKGSIHVVESNQWQVQ